MLLLVGVSAACERTVVTAVDVAELEVDPASFTLRAGERRTLSVTLRERGGAPLDDRAVSWSVDDPEVATVSPEGEVEGREEGTTLVHARSGKATGSAEVRVVAAGEPTSPPPADDPDPPSGSCDVRNRTFDDDVEIPRNVSCTFTNVRIRGDLELESGASLLGTRLRVDGGVEAERASGLTLIDSEIGGSIDFEKGGRFELRNSSVDGNLEIENNDGRILLDGNTIDGNVEVSKNRGGPFTISRNDIDGNLKCKDNKPDPVGSGNRVEGKKQDQCRKL